MQVPEGETKAHRHVTLRVPSAALQAARMAPVAAAAALQWVVLHHAYDTPEYVPLKGAPLATVMGDAWVAAAGGAVAAEVDGDETVLHGGITFTSTPPHVPYDVGVDTKMTVPLHLLAYLPHPDDASRAVIASTLSAGFLVRGKVVGKSKPIDQEPSHAQPEVPASSLAAIANST